MWGESEQRMSKQDYELDDRGSISGRGTAFFSLRYRVRTGSEGQPASYPVGTGGSYAGSKAARA